MSTSPAISVCLSIGMCVASQIALIAKYGLHLKNYSDLKNHEFFKKYPEKSQSEIQEYYRNGHAVFFGMSLLNVTVASILVGSTYHMNPSVAGEVGIFIASAFVHTGTAVGGIIFMHINRAEKHFKKLESFNAIGMQAIP